MSGEYLASLAGWYFLPGLVTNWAQTIYYSITIRAGEPHPQPGTPVFNRHRRNVFTLVIVSYLLFTIYQTDWQLRQVGDFYSDLALPRHADEKTLQRLLRRALALAHPDKYGPSQQESAALAFGRVKEAYDTLTDPVRRFAYERFGPDMLAWKNCKTTRDFVMQGAQSSCVTMLSTLVVMLIAQTFGQMQHGKYWRYLTLAALLVFELHTMTRATEPALLRYVLNPLLSALPGFRHPPYLPFQLVKLARQTAFSFFIAVNQLAPWWAPPATAAQEEAVQNQLLSQIRRIVAATTLDSQRLLALEHAPFAGSARSESAMRERLVEWLVQNEVRNDPAVSAAMKRAIERRNAEVDAHGSG
ncbi:uncharacterized protein PV09_06943 [Verruconis gallopava]|uniref:J domain-containing protein n=1 Tax=Verruconis gallopava TaxID=253628 RepID=A0A0D1XHQ3_9PEZI|nr:uncharacterized protein PV09_06943 [Verruconis gallopava]KIW01771.1 hypothetical protein PV09_06943 [Verruconis gallopava]